MGVDLIKNLRINEKTKKISYYLADGNMEPIEYYLINDKNSKKLLKKFWKKQSIQLPFRDNIWLRGCQKVP